MQLLTHDLVNVLRPYVVSLTPFKSLSPPFWTSELPVASPLVHTILRLMDRWSEELETTVSDSRQPDGYIENLNVDETARGPPIVKYRAMLQPFNTPFE